MADIVKRISEKLAEMPEGIYRECGPVMNDARAEIERLRAENQNLRRWKALDKPLTAAMEIANSHLAQQRKTISEEARRYASHYPQSSDGRNTFLMLAEWIDSRGVDGAENRMAVIGEKREAE